VSCKSNNFNHLGQRFFPAAEVQLKACQYH
jgi:hypothetical protein